MEARDVQGNLTLSIAEEMRTASPGEPDSHLRGLVFWEYAEDSLINQILHAPRRL